jgi:hypothetical protein
MAFPTWPPPSGGAPIIIPEDGPDKFATRYGGSQQSTINSSPPAPAHPWPSTFFPKKLAPTSGQNQPQSLPPWPHASFNVLPDKASPSISAISPPPTMGPSSTVPHLTASQIGRVGPIVRKFPAGSYLDGLGSVVTPTVTRSIGGLGN